MSVIAFAGLIVVTQYTVALRNPKLIIGKIVNFQYCFTFFLHVGSFSYAIKV